MLIRLFSYLIAMFVLLSSSMTPGLALDDRLVGAWKCIVSKPEGQWTVTWNVARDGTYHSTILGPARLPDEYGHVESWGDLWAIRAVGGREDRGTFELSGDELHLHGSEQSHWRRNTGSPAADSVLDACPQLASAPKPEKNGVGNLSAMPGGLSGMVQGALGSVAASVVNKVAGNVPVVRNLSSIVGRAATSSATTSGVISTVAAGMIPAPVQRVGAGLKPLAQMTTALPIGGSADEMLTANFPLPPAADEAQQFCIPELGRVAGSGMIKRRYRNFY